jgi:ubiquinone/menaquinone biosynthesis C-methylase UbiE
MDSLSSHINELKAAEAFSKQSEVFDQLYESNTIIRYKRKRVREHFLAHAPAGGHVLELNCGTGEDALFLNKQGFGVHATDIAEGMLAEAREKAIKQYASNISFEQCSFTKLEELQQGGPYDTIFSNFGGLNCTDELEKVVHSFPALLRSQGIVTLVIVSRFCLWEFLLLFTGRFATAFRRLFSKKGRSASLEGKKFRCWYYSPRQVMQYAQSDFRVLDIEGLCTFVPPSYIEHFPERYPKLFSFLVKLEARFSRTWPFRNIGDYFIITLQKK